MCIRDSSIPVRSNTGNRTQQDTENDSEGEIHPDCQLRWRSQNPTLRSAGVGALILAEFGKNPGLEERLHQRQDTFVLDPQPYPVHQGRVRDRVKTRLDVSVEYPRVSVGAVELNLSDRVLGSSQGPEPVGDRLKVGLEDGFQHQLQRSLNNPVGDDRNS